VVIVKKTMNAHPAPAHQVVIVPLAIILLTRVLVHHAQKEVNQEYVLETSLLNGVQLELSITSEYHPI